jgi:hypothetical protein
MALALAGLAGGIVLLYILKLRRTRLTVASTLLWEQSLRDYKANAPWQRLRSNLLMYLQIIAILLLALALARPFVFGTALTGGRLVLVVDTSASMLARDETPDRLGRALAAAASAISDLGRAEEAMVIGAGPQPRVLQSFTGDKGQLEAALLRIRPLAGGVTDLNAALRLVSSIAAGSQGRARVIIFSDGAVPDLDSEAATDLQISFYPLGSEGGNVGIVSAGARRQPFGETYEVFAAMHNYFPTQREVDLTISVADSVLDVRTVQIPPGQRRNVELSGLPYTDQALELRIEDTAAGDLLPVDDAVWITLPLQQRFRVALATQRESVLLRRVLASMQDIDLYTWDGEQLTGSMPNPSGTVDIWVVEGDAPARVDPGASYLFINSTQSPLLPVQPGEQVATDFSADPPVIPSVVGSDPGNSILRYVNISDLRLNGMRRVRLQPWSRTVVDASEGPLLVEGNRDGQRSIYFAFDLYESDLPLRAAFPILMANALNALGSGAAGGSGRPLQAGQRLDLTAPVWAEQVKIELPNGSEQVQPLSSRGLTLTDTSQPGIIRLTFSSQDGQNMERLIPVGLLSEDESNIMPSATLRIKGEQSIVASATDSSSGAQVIEGVRQVRVNNEFYAWLIGAVLVLILLEWYLYHTRAF